MNWYQPSFSALTEDEFRLLAFMRGYADNRDQSLDPCWIGEQLEFTLDQLRHAARSLAARRLVEFFEWQPHDPAGDAQESLKEFAGGPIPMNLRMTQEGWDYLRKGP